MEKIQIIGCGNGWFGLIQIIGSGNGWERFQIVGRIIGLDRSRLLAVAMGWIYSDCWQWQWVGLIQIIGSGNGWERSRLLAESLGWIDPDCWQWQWVG